MKSNSENIAIPGIQRGRKIHRLPEVSKRARNQASGSGHGAMMAVCCAAMVAGFGLLAFLAQTGLVASPALLSALPVAACIGVHFAMYWFMGKSCHGSKQHDDAATILTEPKKGESK